MFQVYKIEVESTQRADDGHWAQLNGHCTCKRQQLNFNKRYIVSSNGRIQMYTTLFRHTHLMSFYTLLQFGGA